MVQLGNTTVPTPRHSEEIVVLNRWSVVN